MKAKALLLSGLCFALLVVSTSAATVFRVSVDGQADILTTAPPVERGSVVLVRRLSDGRMTAIPSELVRAVSTVPKSAALKVTNLATGKASRTLTSARAATSFASSRASAFITSPLAGSTRTASGGTVIMLGPTGGTATTPLSRNALVVPAASASPATAGTPRNSIESQIFRGDLPRLTPRGTELTLNTPATATPATALTEIGPNGFPIFANVTVPSLATVGPNGFLTSAPTTGPQAGSQPIAPNGFPDTSVAPFAQTGLTPAGTGRATTIPQTTTASRSASGAVVTAPGAANVSAPAAGGAATASPQ